MNTFFSLNNVSCGYHQRTVLNDISLSVQEGEFLGIIGPNGAGKSTLLKTMSRCLKPSQGSILFQDKDIYSLSYRQVARQFAFVPQDTALFFTYTVWDVVLMGRTPFVDRMHNETSKDFEAVQKSLEATESVHLRDRLFHELSAGEKQLVAVARALAQRPTVLFLDEPTSHLDIGHQIHLLNLFLSQLNRQQRMTMVVVLHDLNLASEYCDRVVLLDNGRVAALGEPQNVLTYQNIEAVYRTLVVVNQNPISRKPHVLLIRGLEN